jgi:hypothetical protein
MELNIDLIEWQTSIYQNLVNLSIVKSKNMKSAIIGTYLFGIY